MISLSSREIHARCFPLLHILHRMKNRNAAMRGKPLNDPGSVMLFLQPRYTMEENIIHNLKNKGVPALDDYMKTNQAWWNEAAQVHAQGDAYQMKAFKEGLSKLHPLELAEVGDVAGKKLLHLQCHFGMDTLSWARSGAQVTGID